MDELETRLFTQALKPRLQITDVFIIHKKSPAVRSGLTIRYPAMISSDCVIVSVRHYDSMTQNCDPITPAGT